MSNKYCRGFVIPMALTLILIGCGGGSDAPEPEEPPITVEPADTNPQLSLLFNEQNGSQTAVSEIGNIELHITNNFSTPERVPGVEGTALRTDGYSTWAHGNFILESSSSLTAQTWVALENYPADAEVSHNNLSPSALFHQATPTQGFSLDINTFGQWQFRVTISNTIYTVKAPELFPLYQWVHVAAVVDGSVGNIRLYLNGQQVAIEESNPVDGTINFANVDFTIGKGFIDQSLGIFPLINGINGVFDNTQLYIIARTTTDIVSDYDTAVANMASTVAEALKVPAKRFIADLQRPKFHGMPDSAWTNEPHGLVEFKDKYHMFYQGTPNGPFKSQTLWGHTISDDFVHWKNQKNVLIPSLEDSDTKGYDMKGIWAGDVVVVENDVAYAFYTNVNHTGPYNPGIAVAISTDDNLEHWQKLGPIIDTSNVDDFRDPYLFKYGDTWHMLIGAKVNGSGGLDHYISTDISDMDSWKSTPFSTVNYADMDTGSDVWELPVFEPIGNGKHILVMNPIGGSLSRFAPNPVRTVYWIGTWQNGLFTPDFTQPKNFDVIHGHLSPTVARNTDNELVSIGIVDERRNSQAQLDAGWTHTYSLPRVWGLASDNATLIQKPSPTLSSLRLANSELTISNQVVNGEQLVASRGRSVEIIVEVNSTDTAENYGLVFAASADGREVTKLYYDVANQQIVLDKSASSLAASSEELSELRGDYDESVFGKPEKFHVFIDHSVIDVFINDKAAFSARIYPTLADSEHIKLYSPYAETTFTSIQIWQLENIGDKRSYATLSTDSEIVESAENGKLITVTLVNNTFKTSLTSASWQINNLPDDVAFDNLTRISDTQASFTLVGNSSVDFDEDINLVLSIDSNEFSQNDVLDTIVATGAVITAIKEIVTEATLSSGAAVYEGSESGQQITVNLTHNSFVEPINLAHWSASNLPQGLTFTVSLINKKTAVITLSGTAENYGNENVSVTFVAAPEALANVDVELFGQPLTTDPIVFKARIVVGVSVADDAYDNVISSFDSVTDMLADNWAITGAFSELVSPDAWQGTTLDSAAAKIGLRAMSTCEINHQLVGCDAALGTLTSPIFELVKPYVYGLISGGNGSNSVGMRVLDSIGNVLFSYTPNSCDPSFVDGDNDWTTFDVSAAIGANVRLQFFDEEPANCGFLSAEHFYQSMRSPDSSDGQLPQTLINGGVLSLTTQMQQSLSYNVTLPYADSDQNVIGRFDNAQQMLTDGWIATGDFMNPSDARAWTGSARNGDDFAARVGSGAVSTCEINNNSEGCDVPVGTLTSPAMAVSADTPLLSFLMAGGNGSAPVGLQVLDASDDSVIASHTPNSCDSSFIDGNEDWVTLDLTANIGQQVKVRIFDEESLGCGFVSFDHLHFSSGAAVDATMVDFNTHFDDVSEEDVNESLINVAVNADAFEQVIGSFDDALQMIANGWVATGMFSNPVSARQGTAKNSNGSAARVGLGAVGTCELPNAAAGCDTNTGTLTSPTFKVDSNRMILNFLMAGGNGSSAVGLQVLSADTEGVLESFIPNSCSPSHIESDDDWQSIDLSAYVGKFIKVHIYDNADANCGFVSFDHVYMGVIAQ
ncbi:MAG: GH32 C-terminal domain-containing protein [Colwellia sp.]